MDESHKDSWKTSEEPDELCRGYTTEVGKDRRYIEEAVHKSYYAAAD